MIPLLIAFAFTTFSCFIPYLVALTPALFFLIRPDFVAIADTDVL